jgi:hypothetical protein
MKVKTGVGVQRTPSKVKVFGLFLTKSRITVYGTLLNSAERLVCLVAYIHVMFRIFPYQLGFYAAWA